jgi:hypothetical protein
LQNQLTTKLVVTNTLKRNQSTESLGSNWSCNSARGRKENLRYKETKDECEESVKQKYRTVDNQKVQAEIWMPKFGETGSPNG